MTHISGQPLRILGDPGAVSRVMDKTLTPSPWTTQMDYPWTTLKSTTPKNARYPDPKLKANRKQRCMYLLYFHRLALFHPV